MEYGYHRVRKLDLTEPRPYNHIFSDGKQEKRYIREIVFGVVMHSNDKMRMLSITSFLVCVYNLSLLRLQANCQERSHSLL